MTTFFTADTHFGHERIIELAKRPFATVEEMDQAMIQRWNAVVTNSDVVYHLGDFAFSDHTPYLRQLNGQKHLILGNHDHSNRVSKAEGWQSVEHYREVKIADDHLILFHYGMRVWNKSHHGSIHLYGHSHNNLVGDNQCTDVGVDCWMFAPITLEMIKKRLSYMPKRFEPDHHKPKDVA